MIRMKRNVRVCRLFVSLLCRKHLWLIEDLLGFLDFSVRKFEGHKVVMQKIILLLLFL